MPRPTKCRKVCHYPKTVEFQPIQGSEGQCVILTVDEYETIRLIDQEGLSQEQCPAEAGHRSGGWPDSENPGWRFPALQR